MVHGDDRLQANLDLPQRVMRGLAPGSRVARLRMASDSPASRFDLSRIDRAIGLDARIDSKGAWARVELELGTASLKQGQRFELVGLLSSRTLHPLQAVILIVRRPGRPDVSCVIAQNLVLPIDPQEMHFAIEWRLEDVEGHFFIAFQSGNTSNVRIHSAELQMSAADFESFTAGSRAFASMATKRRTNVVVCVHNALDDARACLASVALACKQDGSRLIVVNDGSGSDTSRFLRDFCRSADCDVTLVHDRSGSGYTKAVNRGVAISDGDLCILLNSDTVVQPTLIASMELMVINIGYDLAGPLSNRATLQSVPLIVEDGSWSDNKAIDVSNLSRVCSYIRDAKTSFALDVSLLNGFCLAIRTEVFSKVGLFDENFFPTGYGEETDFELRCLKLGYRSGVCQKEFVFHSGSQSYALFQKAAYSDRAYSTACAKHGEATVQGAFQASKAILEKAEIRDHLAEELRNGL